MLSADEIKIVAFGVIFGGGLVVRAIQKHKKLRRVEDIPLSKIASAPQGLVELQGFAWPMTQTFQGPDQVEAVYYSLVLQKEETHGYGKNRRKRWVTVFSHVHGVPFYVVDPTGLALVYPQESQMDLDQARERMWRSIPSEEQARIMEKVIHQRIPQFPPSSAFFGLFGPRFRILESEIRVGAPVYAMGNFMTSSSPGAIQRVKLAGLTDFSSRVFDKNSRSLRNLLPILDKNKDGVIDAQEAKLGYSFAARRSRAKGAPDPGEQEFQVFGTVGSNEHHKLLLADAHQHHLSQRMGRFLWTKFAVGCAMIAVALWYVLSGGVENLRRPARQISGHQHSTPSE